MLRAYVRPVGQDRKQNLKPIGWWCPECKMMVMDQFEIFSNKL